MLFGHQNDDVTKPDDAVAPSVHNDGMNPLAVDPATGASLPAISAVPADAPEPSILDQPTSADPITTAPPVVTAAPQFVAPDPITPDPPLMPPAPVEEATIPEAPASPAPTTDLPGADDDLLSLKQQALTQLSPLVSHLDQTPEEKFRTTMMMIQSTDNQALIKDAYAAAQEITDEKVRAQALLDIVNEINYFTQPKPNN